MPSPLVETVRQLAAPPIEAAGYELVDLEWKHEPGGMVCRVFIDRPGATVSTEDCAIVSRDLSVLLDVHDPLPGHYSLEVSSPGLDRPLRTLEHFRRFVGERAHVRLCAGLAGRRNYTGRIVSAEEPGTITLEVDGTLHGLPLADLECANLVPELARPAKPGQRPKRR